jgi:FixJ family two-component response regulator
VAREIKRLSPQTPVILMTGWGINFSPDELSRDGIDFTLAKPFRIEQLTEIIARARPKHQTI